MVFWGRQRLGMIAPHQPLVVERPRDSGPLDVIVRASGFLPVQTRAYTFADSKVSVKMTPPDQKKTLLGYREAVPDGGASRPAAESHTPDAGFMRVGERRNLSDGSGDRSDAFLDARSGIGYLA